MEAALTQSESITPQISSLKADAKPVTPKLPWIRQAVQYLTLAVLGIASYLLVSHYVLQAVQVVGISMVPTLHDTDHYFLNRWSYYFHPPKRGDVVVIKDPSDGTYAVKRIIALSGEAVFFKHGRVYVNGKPLPEPYLQQGTMTFTGDGKDEMVTCGTDQFFVMGDNRNYSFDSRIYGPVPRRNIVGTLIR